VSFNFRSSLNSGSFDERLHFDPLRDIDGEPDSLTAGRRNLVYGCIDTVLTPRSEEDLRSVLLAPVMTATWS
jgi:hypothetical protein